ncbi:PTS sugar transporter subunit IIB [Mycoplasmatota bacterium]|nr:PTS sugar transporter subunit IIB [Mycoplasmatota bacterium]
MKILAVCGFGVGSSMVLKMTIDKACRQLGVDAEVENTDLTSARGVRCDAIFTSFELAEELASSVKVPLYPIKKYMDLEEVKESVEKLIRREI